MNKKLFSVAVMTAVVFLVSGSAAADTYMKQVRHTGAYSVMGQNMPEKNETTETWIGDKAGRVNLSDGTSMLMIFADQKVYALKHSDRTYSEMPVSMDKMMDEAMAAAGPEDEDDAAASEMMRNMAGAMMSQIKVSVRDTGEKKKIGEWNARKYEMITEMGAMGKSVSEVWASEELKVDMNAYQKARGMMQMQQPGMEKMMKEMEKIKGVIVKSISSSQVMGAEVKTTEELVDFSSKAAPANTFKLPSDYRKVPFVSGMQTR